MNYLDNLINCWYKNVPYLWIPNKSLDKCQRLYFLHENCFVYYKNKSIELYKVFSNNYDLEDVFIYNSEEMEPDFPHNLFKVMNPYKLDKNYNYYINGKKIKIPNNESLYLYLWRTFGFKEIKYIEINRKENSKYIELIESISPLNFDDNPINSETELFENYNINFDVNKITRKYYTRPREYKDFIFYLNDNFPRKPYSDNLKLDYPNYHIGQLKLLISEIFFLTQKLNNLNEYCICVYIGSAGGFHIPVLANMFPNILFMLYDGAKHYINPTYNIIIHQELFLEPNVKLFKDVDVYFISDIRVADQDYYKFERNVYIDNLLNRHIVMSLDPKKSLLKFRFPFEIENEDEKIYLSGKFLLQTFAPNKSAETRLIPFSNGDLVEGDPKKYEEQMFYFNTEYRNRSFEDLDRLFGLNYDFYSFYKTMEMFLQKKGKNEIKNCIIIFCKNLEKIKAIGRPKSLQGRSLLSFLFGYNPKLTKK